MPTWGQLVEEVKKEGIAKKNPFIIDVIRKRSIQELYDYTKINTLVYFSNWTMPTALPQLSMINEEDIQGFMEALVGIKGDRLDIVLHTGGGSAETTEAIVSYLRKKFNYIRVIIPQAAMSAGTMLACSADEIVMAKHSSLGPIDPQFVLQTSVGIQALPAHAIIEQFEMAKKECAENPANMNSWLPMLSQYGPALLVRCKNQIEFSKNTVEKWLNDYMFKNSKNNRAAQIAYSLCDHNSLKTHFKHIDSIEGKKMGLNITELESDQILQEKVLTAFHACNLSFNFSSVSKIIANHYGNSFIKQAPIRPNI